MKTVIIAGGTGSIGTVLKSMLLTRGYRVHIFTRYPEKYQDEPNLKYIYWNPAEGKCDPTSISEADGIIGLAGAGIADRKWYEKRKKEIYDSRILGSKLLVEAMENTPNKIKIFVGASATGYYGVDRNSVLKEEDKSGQGFLAKVCRDWEATVQSASDLEKRVVILRTGVVLDRKTGAYPKMTSSVNFGLAGIIGSGMQIMSWIHIVDLCRIYIHALEDESFSGVYNACSPHPVSLVELIEASARAKKKRIFKFKVPLFVIRAMVGELVDEALLQSSNINVDKLIAAGFQFRYPTIEAVVRAIEKGGDTAATE